jgi:hypothetical protein
MPDTEGRISGLRRLVVGLLLAGVVSAGVAGLFAPPVGASGGCCGIEGCGYQLSIICNDPGTDCVGFDGCCYPALKC